VGGSSGGFDFLLHGLDFYRACLGDSDAEVEKRFGVEGVDLYDFGAGFVGFENLSALIFRNDAFLEGEIEEQVTGRAIEKSRANGIPNLRLHREGPA
jgi:hypothetical protein